MAKNNKARMSFFSYCGSARKLARTTINDLSVELLQHLFGSQGTNLEFPRVLARSADLTNLTRFLNLFSNSLHDQSLVSLIVSDLLLSTTINPKKNKAQRPMMRPWAKNRYR